jgi:hypothetical protein
MPDQKIGYLYVVHVTGQFKELSEADRQALLDKLQEQAQTVLKTKGIPAAAVSVTNGEIQKKTPDKK